MFRIAHISDLHCGSPYFVPDLMERAIMEINELAPEIVVCSGDLTAYGFKPEYAEAKAYLDRLSCRELVVVPGNHDSRNVGYIHFEELFGERNPVVHVNGVSVVAVDSTEPDLDHGHIGRNRYRWIQEQFSQEADFRIFVLHHHLLPVPGTGRERNIVYDAGDTLEALQRARVNLVLSGHKHVPYAWRLENIFVVNAGTVSTLRLRGNTRPCYNLIEIEGRHVDVWRKYPYHDQERIIQFSADTLEFEKYTTRIESEVTSKPVRALALIDGEHYPDVLRVAFAGLEHDVAVLLGGTEKLRGGEDYGVPVFETLEEAFEAIAPEVVVDLSDEPVADPPRRFRLASRTLARGVAYVGADFRFDPVRFEPFELPALAVIGTGKRVGKTAVAGHIARLLSRDREVVVVAMGRGGPREPVVVDREPEVAELLELSRAGGHAASDYLEGAAFASVVTVGSRRAGGGLAGAPFYSNLPAAAELAASLAPDLVLFEGSGAAIPPVEAARRVLVVGASQDPDTVIGYLGAYRVLLSDLVVLTGCEEPLAGEDRIQRLKRAIADVDRDMPVVETIFRPRPVRDVSGRRVAYFSTAPAAAHARLREHLRREHDAEIVHVSGNLSRRPELRADLASLEARSAELYLVELKAAAIDVVAETAAERGVPIVLCDNEVRTVDGESLDERVLDLVDSLAGVRA